MGESIWPSTLPLNDCALRGSARVRVVPFGCEVRRLQTPAYGMIQS